MKRKYLQVEDLNLRLDKRKNYKNIRIRVLPPQGELVATCPEYISDRVIKAFVRKNIKSIRLTIDKQKEIYKDRQVIYENDAYIKVFGEDYRLVIDKSDKNKGQIQEGKILLSLKDTRNIELVEKEMDKLLRKILRDKTKAYIKKYQEIMGLDIRGFSIRKMKTKWGTCNITDRFIWINLELVKYKPSCLEYIVVHELAHLLNKNHDKDFYKIVEKHYPSYREIEEYLDRQIIVN